MFTFLNCFVQKWSQILATAQNQVLFHDAALISFGLVIRVATNYLHVNSIYVKKCATETFVETVQKLAFNFVSVKKSEKKFYALKQIGIVMKLIFNCNT